MVEIRCHSCATALGGAAEVVAIEQGDGLARGIGDLKDLHVAVVGWQVGCPVRCANFSSLF